MACVKVSRALSRTCLLFAWSKGWPMSTRTFALSMICTRLDLPPAAMVKSEVLTLPESEA